jgi:hypothetical protein
VILVTAFFGQFRRMVTWSTGTLDRRQHPACVMVAPSDASP